MQGIVPSLNTPFDDSGAVDGPSLRKLVDHTVDAGCGGMLGLAVAGEFPSLDMDEKIFFIETVVEQNKGRIPFIVSVTASDVDQSMKLAKLAQSTGADGICMQVPLAQDIPRSIATLQEIAEAGPDILMVQDLDWSGYGLELDAIEQMYEEIDKFSWLKIETVLAGPKYSAVRKMCGGCLKVCGGWAVSQLLDALQREVDAFIPTGMERVYMEIYSRYHAGKHDEARELFERLSPVLNFSNQHIDVSIRFFKALRKAEGLFASDACRDLVAKLDPVQERECKRAMDIALVLQEETSQ